MDFVSDATQSVTLFIDFGVFLKWCRAFFCALLSNNPLLPKLVAGSFRVSLFIEREGAVDFWKCSGCFMIIRRFISVYL